jgi:AcrR family transcriptional regulator
MAKCQICSIVIAMERLRRPRLGRPLSFDRAAALAQALRLFWAQGYEGTSIADLTEVMGISPPSLYAAFGSKANLYREVLAVYQQGPGRFSAEALASESTTRAAIRRLLCEAAQVFAARRNPGGCLVSNAVLGCAPEHRAVAHDVASLRTRGLRAIEERLKRALNEGELKSGANVTILARYIGAIVQGMSVQARDGASERELAGVAELAMVALPLRKRGIRKKPRMKRSRP